MSWKRSSLVRCEMLGLFGNMLTADHMYFRHRREKLQEQVETLLSEERRTFCQFLLHFRKLHKILLILK